MYLLYKRGFPAILQIPLDASNLASVIPKKSILFGKYDRNDFEPELADYKFLLEKDENL